ncbi:MAG: hypothetical protein WCP29_11070 [Acidobacteriota bacterium]
MKYKGVKRIITILVSPARGKKQYAIDICPDPSEIMVGDTVEFQVQSAAHGVEVKAGHFRRLDPPAEVQLRQGKAPLTREHTIRPTGSRGQTLKPKTADIGFYKFDIMFDGNTVLDPEMEIRGPRV